MGDKKRSLILYSSPELAEKWINYQRYREANPEVFGLISTGFRGLDTVLGGGTEPGELAWIGGPPKIGKSILLECMAIAAGRQKKNFIFMSAEQHIYQVGTMVFSNMASIDRVRVRGIQLTELDWSQIDKARPKVEGLTGYWNYGFSTVEDIDILIDEAEQRSGDAVHILFGDYLQLMEVPAVKGTRVDQITYLSRNIKLRTIQNPEHPKAMIFGAQLNRQSIRQNQLDMQSWLGGGIERDMDWGAILNPVKDVSTGEISEDLLDLEIVGSRYTGKGKPVRMRRVGHLARMVEDLTEDEVRREHRFMG